MAFIDFTFDNSKYTIDASEIVMVKYDDRDENYYTLPTVVITFKNTTTKLIFTHKNLEYLQELYKFISAMTTYNQTLFHFVPHTEVSDAPTNS